MKKVNFTEMKNGTKEDYQLLEKYERNFERRTADRIIKICQLKQQPWKAIKLPD